MAVTKAGVQIDSLDEWREKAGPKSPGHSVDGRSAKEVARAWLASDTLPSEVVRALATHVDFAAVHEWKAEPEAKLVFDSFAGEPRNSDLAVTATDGFGPLFMAVEAKADEPFGETVADALAAAVERRLESERSNGVRRIEQLAAALLGPRSPDSPMLKSMRYQLLTAAAGRAMRSGAPWRRSRPLARARVRDGQDG